MSEIEKQFFETFEIEPKYKFKGCENGITFYTYGCDIPSCKGCPKEIREKEYPQITDHVLLELICILNDFEGIDVKATTVNELKEELLKQAIEPLKYTIAFEEHYEIEKLYHKVQALFKGVTHE